MKSKAVEEMIGVNVSGNVIPIAWFDNIKMPESNRSDDAKHYNIKRKPDTIAILLLADIVYWYRPIEIRDEATGRIVEYKQKFKADKLQRSYQSFADQYGFTKEQVRDALHRLEDRGVISLELRKLTTDNGIQLNNVLYIGLNVDTYRDISRPLSTLIPIGMGIEVDTNTEITTETTTENFNAENSDEFSDEPHGEPIEDEYQKKRKARQESTKRAFVAGMQQHQEIVDLVHQLFKLSISPKRKDWKELILFLKETGNAEDHLRQFAKWWYINDWRGKRGQPPTAVLIRELLPQAQKNGKKPMTDEERRVTEETERMFYGEEYEIYKST